MREAPAARFQSAARLRIQIKIVLAGVAQLVRAPDCGERATGFLYHLKVWRRDDLTLSKYEEFSLTRLNRQLTARTIEGYLSALKRLRVIIGDKELGEYSSNDAEQWRATLSLQGLENSTINVNIRGLKAMFNRAVELKLIGKNPFSRMKLCKVPKTAPSYLHPEDLTTLLVHVRKNALKDIYTFLWHTGLRITELINLKWADVDMKRGWMIIMFSKSGRSRGVPLNKVAAGVLEKFPTAKRTGYVFKNRRGEPLKRTAISHSFKKAVRRAGLPEGLQSSLATTFHGKHRVNARDGYHNRVKTSRAFVHTDNFLRVRTYLRCSYDGGDKAVGVRYEVRKGHKKTPELYPKNWTGCLGGKNGYFST